MRQGSGARLPPSPRRPAAPAGGELDVGVPVGAIGVRTALVWAGHHVGRLLRGQARRVQVQRDGQAEPAVPGRANPGPEGDLGPGRVQPPAGRDRQQCGLKASRITYGEQLLRGWCRAPLPPVDPGTGKSTSSRLSTPGQANPRQAAVQGPAMAFAPAPHDRRGGYREHPADVPAPELLLRIAAGHRNVAAGRRLDRRGSAVRAARGAPSVMALSLLRPAGAFRGVGASR